MVSADTGPAVGTTVRRPWSQVALAALAVASLAVYWFALVVPYHLPRFVAQPLLDLGKIGGYAPADGARFTATLGALWVLYLLAGVCRAPEGIETRVAAYGGTLAFGCALLWLYPITAADLFNYLLYGLVQHRGANPLTTPPAAVIGPSLLDYSAWPDHPSPYGPVWQWLAFAVTAATGERLFAGVVAFKVVLLGCHLLNVALIERLATQLGAASPTGAALLYGWNPLLLYETAGNGHNDIVMLTALLLALTAYSADDRVRTLTVPLATLGALAKFVGGLWLPALALALWRVEVGRQALRRLAAGLVGAAILAFVCYAPFWAGGETFVGVRRQADLATTSLGGLVVLWQRDLLPADLVLDLVKGIALATLALTLVWRRPRRGTLHELLGVLFDLALVYLLLGALWFQPWYLVPLVGLAPLLDRPRRALALAYALGATASYLVYFYVWPALDWTSDRLLIQTIATWAAHGPVLAVLAALGCRRWWPWLARRALVARRSLVAPSGEGDAGPG